MARLQLARRSLLATAILPLLGNPSRADDLRDIAMAVSSTSFVLGGVLIGQQAGLFEKRGIRLKIVVMDSGSAAMSALLGGSVQFAVAGPGELLAARARGVDVAVVASLYHNFAGSLVLSKSTAAKLAVHPDAPQRDRLKALDGLVIAVPSATSALLAPVRSAALAAGATIRFTYMAQPAMVAALESGAIDGFVASFPFAGKPILKGTGITWINGVGGDLPAASLPASSSTMLAAVSYVGANRAMVAMVQNVMADIGTYIRANPGEAKVMLAKGYPQLGGDEVALAFDAQKGNWTNPFLTIDDMRHELELLRASTDLPGLANLDISKTLIPPP